MIYTFNALEELSVYDVEEDAGLYDLLLCTYNDVPVFILFVFKYDISHADGSLILFIPFPFYRLMASNYK